MWYVGGVPLLLAAGQEFAQISLLLCFISLLHFCGLCAGQLHLPVGQKEHNHL